MITALTANLSNKLIESFTEKVCENKILEKKQDALNSYFDYMFVELWFLSGLGHYHRNVWSNSFLLEKDNIYCITSNSQCARSLGPESTVGSGNFLMPSIRRRWHFGGTQAVAILYVVLITILWCNLLDCKLQPQGNGWKLVLIIITLPTNMALKNIAPLLRCDTYWLIVFACFLLFTSFPPAASPAWS